MRAPQVDEYFTPVSYHIEHHLFPKVPDENLHKLTAEVMALTADHGLPYRTEPIEALAWGFLAKLAAVPRDRWGAAGLGAALPALVLVVGMAAACCGLGARRGARARLPLALQHETQTRRGAVAAPWHEKAQLMAEAQLLEELEDNAA